MKKMSSSDLTARINRFMDRKLSKVADLGDLSNHSMKNTHRKSIQVSDSQYIALAIK